MCKFRKDLILEETGSKDREHEIELNLVVCVFSKLPRSVFETSSSPSMVFVAHIKKSWPMVCNHNENHLEGAATTCLDVEKS